MILYSKITPERPQITPTSYQSHAFGTYCLFWALAKKSSLSHSPPQPRETPHTLNGPTVTVFRFRSEKKTYQWSKLGKKKDYQNMVRTHMGNVTKRFVNAFYRFE